MRNYYFLLFFLFSGLTACKINKKASNPAEKITLDEVVVEPSTAATLPPYRPMETRIIDLLHTTLYLEFDYKNQWVMGRALLKIKPYAAPLHAFDLDAKGYSVLQVALVSGKDTTPVEYAYDSRKLHIQLKKLCGEYDTMSLYVQYIAKPNEIDNTAGKAISDSRGLYFINPQGTDPNKPRQIWSQGETEYNSCWFPTVDAPNEKHTQDIYLTVDSADVTLSNGLLLDSKILKNAKRTDHWQQLKPHAPYLTMIAIGNFVITKDKWRNMEVSYYLEPNYAPYARTIFGKTPQMIETFSKITGVDYPWDKFSQIVCRDFVSGAMENTSAVLHYEAVQHTDREHMDNPQEEIIVHELFHHWFGDLVTSRSWSNIPLNESFATYGEYLYNEATYGKDYADMVFSKNLSAYLRSKHKHHVSPIRKYYNAEDEVFDVVSYQKGSWILHQLRNEIGSEAFFKGINRYLTQNAYSYADIHNLRHAMEWASGKDLQLFFKQWFEGIGHPELKLNAKRLENLDAFQIDIRQVQDSGFGVFDIHTQIAFVIESKGKEETVKLIPVHLNARHQKVIIPLPSDTKGSRLSTYWIDPMGNIPGMINESKDANSWLKQLVLAEAYESKLRAIKSLSDLPFEKAELQQREAITYLLNRKEYYFQLSALDLLEKIDTLYPEFEEKVIEMANQNPKPEVRSNAMYLLGYKGKSDKIRPIILKGLEDSSYNVIATSLQALSLSDQALCLEKCKEMEVYPSAVIQRTISWLYARYAKENKNAYYKSVLGKYGFTRTSILNAYGNYLKLQNKEILVEGLKILERSYDLNSDRSKGKQFKSVLMNIQGKSKEAEVFQEHGYTKFLERVQKDSSED